MFFKKKKKLDAFVTGKVVPLTEVKDEVFSTGMMGEGLAIYPVAGRIVSPVDGVIKAANLQMQHAIGLETQEGIELLIHVGLDTVSLANEGFELLVSEGQKVKAGELLLRFDRKVISSAGLDDVVMLIVTNPKDYQFDFQTGIEVVDGEEIGTWK